MLKVWKGSMRWKKMILRMLSSKALRGKATRRARRDEALGVGGGSWAGERKKEEISEMFCKVSEEGGRYTYLLNGGMKLALERRGSRTRSSRWLRKRGLGRNDERHDRRWFLSRGDGDRRSCSSCSSSTR